MKIIIDITGLENEEEVTKQFNEILDFGKHKNGALIGVNNWDAFNDCLSYLDVGGINGTARKVTFPCTLVIKGFETMKNSNPKDFIILKGILEEKPKLYQKDNLLLQVIFES